MKRLPATNPYVVRLTEPMLIAIVDRAAGHTDKRSPRYAACTTRALIRRGIVYAHNDADLTEKGHAVLAIALYEYQRTLRRGASKRILRIASDTMRHAFSAGISVQ